MNVYIITGTSRGIGESFAKHLLEKENYLFCISRTVNISIEEYAEQNNMKYEYYSFDLRNVDEIENLMKKIYIELYDVNIKKIVLINNAGILDPISKLSKANHKDILNNYNINLIAPTLLSSSFLKYFQERKCEKLILNISSGASLKAYHGWSTYCTSKAGINMLSKSIAKEEEGNKYPVKSISIAPGVVDTFMQAQIRHSTKEKFKEIKKFKKLKEDGNLDSADFVAKKILDFIKKNEFDSGEYYDIRNL